MNQTQNNSDKQSIKGNGKKLGGSERLYEIVYNVLREHIKNGKLPIGLVLLEGPIAKFFETSRAPAQKALRILNEEGLIKRFEGRGFVIPAPNGDLIPLRMDIREAGLQLPSEAGPALRSRSSWKRIYDLAQQELTSAAAFGRYRIKEVLMADFYGVSRTVIRDVLGRLNERGIVQKTAQSRWITGPLTAAATREMFEIRRLLEPAALIEAYPKLDHQSLGKMRDQLLSLETDSDAIKSDLLFQLDRFLHVECVLNIKNQRLALTIRQNQSPMFTNQVFHKYLGTADMSSTFIEHRLVIEHLLRDSPQAAAAALVAHLDAAHERSLSRLKVLSVVPAPEPQPYLIKD